MKELRNPRPKLKYLIIGFALTSYWIVITCLLLTHRISWASPGGFAYGAFAYFVPLAAILLLLVLFPFARKQNSSKKGCGAENSLETAGEFAELVAKSHRKRSRSQAGLKLCPLPSGPLKISKPEKDGPRNNRAKNSQGLLPFYRKLVVVHNTMILLC